MAAELSGEGTWTPGSKPRYEDFEGSIIVVVGDRNDFVGLESPIDDVNVFYLAEADTALANLPGTIALSEGTDYTEAVLQPLLVQVFGKVLRKPHKHFFIDVLLWSGGCDPKLLTFLLQYLHPGGGLVVSQEVLPQLGTPQRKVDCFVYRPPANPENVHFAKMSLVERRWLYERVRQLPARSVYVEIGSLRGGSAVIAALANPGIRICAVDSWVDLSGVTGGLWTDFNVFQRHTQFFDNVFPVRIDLSHVEKGPESIATMEKCDVDALSIDFLFIDGDHAFESVWKDLVTYVPRTRGLVCGHDYTYRGYTGIRKAVDAYFARGVHRRIALSLPAWVWETPLGILMRPAHVKVGRPGNFIWFVEGPWRG